MANLLILSLKYQVELLELLILKILTLKNLLKDYLMLLYEKGVEMHGMKDGVIAVATKEEEKDMEKRGYKIG